MELKVKFFAGLAELTKTKEYTLHTDEYITVKELLVKLNDEFSDITEVLNKSFVSVNHEYASSEHILNKFDEIAIIPPLGGGEDSLYELTNEPLSADEIIKKVTNPYAGTVLTFVGTVREFAKGKHTLALEFEAYPEMAIKKLKQIGNEIKEQWPEAQVAITHRIGRLDISDLIVVIAVATPHRPEAFEAGRYAIERLKKIVPIWEKEIREDGEEWVNKMVDENSGQ